MRSLDRDRRCVYLARYVGLTREVDSQGRLTGRNEPRYLKPEAFWPTVSAQKGEAELTLFGQSLDFDRTLTVDDPAFKVRESDILWVDSLGRDPEAAFLEFVDNALDGGTFDWDDGDDVEGGSFPDVLTTPYDYVVRRVARTPNVTLIAAKRVEVGTDPPRWIEESAVSTDAD